MNKALDRLITLTLIALLGWGGWSVLHWLLVGAEWAESAGQRIPLSPRWPGDDFGIELYRPCRANQGREK